MCAAVTWRERVTRVVGGEDVYTPGRWSCTSVRPRFFYFFFRLAFLKTLFPGISFFSFFLPFFKNSFRFFVRDFGGISVEFQGQGEMESP